MPYLGLISGDWKRQQPILVSQALGRPRRMTGAEARKTWTACAAATSSKTADYLGPEYDMY